MKKEKMFEWIRKQRWIQRRFRRVFRGGEICLPKALQKAMRCTMVMDCDSGRNRCEVEWLTLSLVRRFAIDPPWANLESLR